MRAVVQDFSATVPDVFAGDAVAFLQTVYKDPRIPLRVRLDAAAKAARFERPTSATSSVRSATDDDPEVSFGLQEGDEELLRMVTEAIREDQR
jgi:hypothetical protein